MQLWIQNAIKYETKLAISNTYLLTTKCQILTLKDQYRGGNKYDLLMYECVHITFPKYDSHLFVSCGEK